MVAGYLWVLLACQVCVCVCVCVCVRARTDVHALTVSSIRTSEGF